MNTLNKRIKLFATLFIIMSFISTPFYSFAASKPHIESSKTPEVKNKQKIESSKTPEVTPQVIGPSLPGLKMVTPLTPTDSVQSLSQPTSSLGPNLIQNNSVEASTSKNLPTNWNKGGYGTNNRVLTYPASGYNSTDAIKVSISSYTNGDAKWYFDDVPVVPGITYQFSDYYISNIQSSIDIRYTMTDGTFTYGELVSSVSPSSVYQNISTQFTVPQNVKSVTIFHLINNIGDLTTDDYTLNQISSTIPPVTEPTTNLVPNPDFEQAGTNGLPLSWGKGGYGTNNRTFTYPAAGANGSKAAKVTMTSYTSGDAKWYFNPVPVTAGSLYTYSDQYTSDIPSIITVQYQKSDGTLYYKDIAKLSASNSFVTAPIDISIPSGVKAISVFHLIEGVGSLTIDNVSLIQKSTQNLGIFSTGAVTLRFDDGWLSQYQNALPKLQSTGLKGTFFIVSKQLADNGFSGFINKTQIKEIYNAGNEIGAHTQTHPYLSQLSSTQQQNEIQGSRNDLLSMNVGPITSFSYPYGDYTANTINLVKSDGFNDAAASLDGDVSLTSDKYQLERQSMEVNVTIDQTKKWIDNALANKEWLVLTFHQIDTSGDQYSVTPTMFNQVVDYLKLKNAPVVTIENGVKSLP